MLERQNRHGRFVLNDFPFVVFDGKLDDPTLKDGFAFTHP